jgi:hypothetical protein
MALDTTEAINAALQGAGIAQEILTIVQNLPDERTFAGMNAAFAPVQAKLAALIDQVLADLKD